jgi:carbon starvation protein
MNVLLFTLLCAIFLITAYFTYGRLLRRLFRLDDKNVTPAVEFKDGKDFDPAPKGYLFGQHFSAIAAAGPITGPILAGIMFGWLPALIWILIGSVFVGGVHDLAALTASIRHRARSIAEVVRMHVTHRSYLLFLAFIWIALVYIIVAFTDIIAGAMVSTRTLEDGTTVTGGAIASSSLLYLIIPIAMGLAMRFLKLPLLWATAICLPLVGLAIWGGKYIPLDLTSAFTPFFDLDPLKAEAIAKAEVAAKAEAAAKMTWCLLLMVYCVWASIAPVWLLLQPRGYLGGWFLYLTLGAAAVGILFGGFQIDYPAFIPPTEKTDPLYPFLFITIACGACSGFHSIIASGTTSKQLAKESDALPVAYGSMLLEAMVSVVSLVCVMILTTEALKALGPTKATPDFIYALGQAKFMSIFGVPAPFAITFGLLAFTTFIYDTLDVCTRLGRYIVEELTGWTRGPLRHLATLLTVGVPLFFIFLTLGSAKPAWKTYWPLFGASNQLLAALSLVGVSVWLWQTYRAKWVWFVVGLPTLFMYFTSFSALAILAYRGFYPKTPQTAADPVPYVAYVALVLMALAGWVFIEAVRTILLNFDPPDPPQNAKLELTGAPT